MATRGRRSCGENVGLNPAMIHLLDVARLRKELETRGLDTKGNKLTLADRLEEAVRLGKSNLPDGSSQSVESPSSKPVASRRSTGSILQQQQQIPKSEELDEKLVETSSSDQVDKTPNSVMTTRKRKVLDSSEQKKKATPAKSIKFVWASEAPVEAIEKVSPSVSMNDTESLIKEKENADVDTKPPEAEEGKAELITFQTVTTTASVSPIPATPKTPVEPVDNATPNVSQSTPVSRTQSLRRSKMRISTTTSDVVVSSSVDAKSPIEIIRKKFEVRKRKATEIDVTEKKTTEIHKKKTTDVKESKTSEVLVEKKIAEITESKAVEISSQKNNEGKVEKLKSVSVVSTNMTSATTSTPSTSQGTPGSSRATPTTVQKKSSMAGKTPHLPQRVTAGSIDLLDNIFSKQDKLLADKYKSEQEKATEMHLFELQKRRNSTVASPVTPVEKRIHRSVDGISAPHSPEGSSKNDYDEYLPPVVGVNNRDPLNLRGLEPLSVQTNLPSGQPLSSAGYESYPPPNSAPSSSFSTGREFSSSGRPAASVSQGERRMSCSEPQMKPSMNKLLLSPPPPPPACLLPPIPKSRPTAFGTGIADVIVPPPPPPPRMKPPAEAAPIGSQQRSSNSPSSVALIPPPPPKPRPRPKSFDEIAAPVIVVPPPPPSHLKRSNAPEKSDREQAPEKCIIVVPPPPPPRIKPSKEQEMSSENAERVPEPHKDAELVSEQPKDAEVIPEQSPNTELAPEKSSVAEPVPEHPTNVEPVPEQTTTVELVLEQTTTVEPVPEQKAIIESVSEQLEMTEAIPVSSDDAEPTLESSMNTEPVLEATTTIEPGPDQLTTAELVSEQSKIMEAVPEPLSNVEPVLESSTNDESVMMPTTTVEPVLEQSTDAVSTPESSTNAESVPESSTNADPEQSEIMEAVAGTLTNAESVPEQPTNSESISESSASSEPIPEHPTDAEPVSESSSALEPGNSTEVLPLKTEPAENDDALSAFLLKDPKALLKRATDVLKRINESENLEDMSYSIDQLELDTTDYVIEEEEKPLPDFHGEPVPDDEDDDDMLFEIAAGLRPATKKRDSVPTAAEDEPLPDDEFIELDYYNADMNIKAAPNNKWLIDPDNQDGCALMWGGVKSNYGILVSDAFDAPPSTNNANVSTNHHDSDDDEDVIELDNTANTDMDASGDQPGCNQNANVSTTRSATSRLLPKRVAFQIKITEFLSLKHIPFEELEPHDVRIGWSAAGTSNMLGESSQSYMFCSNARKANSNIFTDYGDPFHVNDVITTVLNFEKREICYYKNGEKLGVAFSNVDFPVGTVVFPHIATKNCKVLVNFGYDDLPESENADDWNLPEEELPPADENDDAASHVTGDEEEEYNGAVMIGLLQRRSGLLVPSRRPPPDKAHCTVIAMVGLPGAGKTSWVKKYLFEHPEEHWVLFNTDTILNAMTVNGVSRRRVHQGRWDMVMGLTAKALNRSLQMACRRRHNYIIDQTNVSRDARRRKLTQFADFQRKCVVILPPDDELERRLLRQVRQEGSAGQIPVEAMLELKGAMSIPCTETEPIEDVLFVEPPIERLNEAIELVKKYNEEGRPWIRKQHATQKPESVISDCRNDTSNPWMVSQQNQQRSSHNSTF